MGNRLFIVLLTSIISCSAVISASSTLYDLPLVDGYSKAYAITAENNGLEGAQKNPATIGIQSKKAFIMNLNQTYDSSIKQVYLGVGTQFFRNTTLAFTVAAQLVDGINETELLNGSAVKVSEFSMLTVEPKISLVVPVVSFLDAGVSFTGVFDTVYNENSSGGSLDFGLLFKWDKFSFGVALQQLLAEKIWSTGLTERLSSQSNAGIKLKLFDSVSLLVDTSSKGKNDRQYNVGSTFDLSPKLSMNIGIHDLGDTNQFRAGSTLKFNSWRLNYAYGRHGVLNDSHKVGVTFDY
jgi:hypothetical protein